MNNYKRGLAAGIPIALGYLSVSFTFGIMAVSYGLSWWQALIISMATVTSAGQFAGIGLMIHPGQYFQMLISQITINIRYSFMSISIAQKADNKFKGIYRWILGFMMTDEIFAVASQEESVTRSFFAGSSNASLYRLGGRHSDWLHPWKYSSGPSHECIKPCYLWYVRGNCSPGNEKITTGDLCRDFIVDFKLCLLLYPASF